MIEFNGYINDAAEKHFKKIMIALGQKILLSSLILLAPVMAMFSLQMKSWLIAVSYGLLFVIIPILLHIPKRPKVQKSLTPKKIYTDGESIVSIADSYTESRFISDVKQVIDYGDFYELVFPFGKISDKFICQKSLLSKGTLEEFEQLFQNKIIRR